MNKNLKEVKSKRIKLIWVIAFLAAFSIMFFFGFVIGVYYYPSFSAPKASKVVLVPELVKYPELYRSEGIAYTLTSSRLSYFALDSSGNLKLQNSLPWQQEGIYRFERTIYPYRTAIVIMDPWIDMASEHLNKYFGKIIKTYIIPLIECALSRGHPIILLTNDPNVDRYNTKIDHNLEKLVRNGKASLLFHQDFDDRDFANFLRSQGIQSLIYIGFSSNKCVIGRRMGMISMNHHDFQIFFVPEASAAIEYADTWYDNSIHRNTTMIISQWIAEIIHYEQFMNIQERRKQN